VISFVGAGPGAPDLITIRGADRLARADVVVWASSLVPEALLSHCAPSAVVHDSKTMTLEDVLAVYRDHPAARIVRLHSGDPTLYGAIQEQIDWCMREERAFEIVPGVSSLAAAAALAQRELTVPGLAQSVILTRVPGRTATSMPERESIGRFAAHGATMAVFLSAAHPGELAHELLAPGSAYTPDTPALIVIRASWPDERVVATTVGRLAGELDAAGATMTVLVLVGDTLRAGGDATARSHLYDPAFTHSYRLRSASGSTVGRASRRILP
jgi:precorrin-4/cobalt-precorrin-4 C11-methyltransferase